METFAGEFTHQNQNDNLQARMALLGRIMIGKVLYVQRTCLQN